VLLPFMSAAIPARTTLHYFYGRPCTKALASQRQRRGASRQAAGPGYKLVSGERSLLVISDCVPLTQEVISFLLCKRTSSFAFSGSMDVAE
jgi:hypothetical protein